MTGDGRAPRAVTRIWLIRHGTTEWNLNKRAQGQADIALTEKGRAQAKEVAVALSAFSLEAVVASDLVRAVDTARPVAQEQGLEVRCDPAFREIDQGEWTGLPTDEIRRRWPDLWGAARHYSTRPGGESPAQVRARALEGLEKIVREHPGGTVAVVSHGGTIRWLVAEAMGYDDRASARLRGVSNAGAVLLEGWIDDERLKLRFVERLDGAGPDLDDPND
ncbi:MAG: histidine phosphatase family protein [Actinomycetota bacterium]|nr:histidine phosphatase family protein [Actinomycetota bacterium]